MTRQDPRVTVVVPTYRRLGLLTGALASLKAQTHPGFVALVCDNDADPAVRAHVEALDDRFRYVERTENLGILGNAVAGFAAAETEFVMELDDDDLLEPDCLRRLVEPFDEYDDLTVSFGGIRLIDEAGAPTDGAGAYGPYPPVRTLAPGVYRPFSTLAAHGLIYMAAALLRTDCVDWAAIPAQVGTSYDRHLALRLAENGRGAHYTDAVLAAYRVHPGADGSRRYVAQLEGAIFAMELALARGSAHDESARAALNHEVTLSRLMQFRRSAATGQLRQATRCARAVLGDADHRAAAATYALTAVRRKLRRNQRGIG